MNGRISARASVCGTEILSFFVHNISMNASLQRSKCLTAPVENPYNPVASQNTLQIHTLGPDESRFIAATG